MEHSPQKIFDHDVSLMLADQVKSQEAEARKFHYNLYTLESVHKSTIPGYYYRDHNIICRAFAGLVRYWNDRWPDSDLAGGTVKQRIMLYEQELIFPTKPRYILQTKPKMS